MNFLKLPRVRIAMLKVFYIGFIFLLNFPLNAGIDTHDLRHNKGLEYFFDIEEGVLKRINEEGVCTPIALSEVPYWSPALDPYHLPLIFVQQQKANNLAEGEVITRQVIKSLAQKQGLWFYIKLTSQSELKRRLVCWFPDWPGLGKIPHDGSTDSNQGVMLLNIQPKYIQDKPFETIEGRFANGAETWDVYAYEYIEPLRKETAILRNEPLIVNEEICANEAEIREVYAEKYIEPLNEEMAVLSDEVLIVDEETCANEAETRKVYTEKYIEPLSEEMTVLSDEVLIVNNQKSCDNEIQGNTFIALPCFANYDQGILTLCGLLAKAILSVDLKDDFIKPSTIGASFDGIGGNFGNQVFDNIKTIGIFNANSIRKAVDI